MNFRDLREGARVAASIDSMENFLQQTHTLHAALACGLEVQEQRHRLSIHFEGAWHEVDETLVIGNQTVLAHVCGLRGTEMSGFFTCLVPQKSMWIGHRILELRGEDAHRRFSLEEQLGIMHQLLR